MPALATLTPEASRDEVDYSVNLRSGFSVMSTFILRLDPGPGDGVRLAVKDVIDVKGLPTTAACPAVEARATPAFADAACLLGARAANARIVGKANLHELAFGATGLNPWFGTPTNPVDPRLIPGGSSSGSAVAVATGDADIAYGTDTGGSIRIPSACCGTVGLKTTNGRVPLEGVFPLAPTLDTVGPMARDVNGVITGMQLLEPGFQVATQSPLRIGRVRRPGVDPSIDRAVDRALAAAEFEIIDIELPGWDVAHRWAGWMIRHEAWTIHNWLLEDVSERRGADVAERIRGGGDLLARDAPRAMAHLRAWRAEVDETLQHVGALALPTMRTRPPSLKESAGAPLADLTTVMNAAGVPALAIPVPHISSVPTSLQLVGPSWGEEQLLAAGLRVEVAIR